MSKLEGQIAIVTGAASGIGRAIVIRFAQEGTKVAIFDIDAKGAKKVAQEIGKQALAIKVDVRDPKQIASAIRKTTKKFGQINILVNNAGITEHATLLDNDVKEKWNRAVATNLTGAFLMTEVVVKEMVKHDWKGNIINITSVHSQVPAKKGAYYTAAKAGLAAATRSWALELAPHGIRVNALAPGAIMNTGMNKDITPRK